MDVTFSYANKKGKEHFPLPTAYLTLMVFITTFTPPRQKFYWCVLVMISTAHQAGTAPYLHQALGEQIMIRNCLYLESLSLLRGVFVPRCLSGLTECLRHRQ